MLLGILQSELMIEKDNFYWKSSFFTLFFPLNPCFHENNALYAFELDFIEFLMLFNIGINILLYRYIDIVFTIFTLNCPSFHGILID